MRRTLPLVALVLLFAVPAGGGVAEPAQGKQRARLKAFTSCTSLVRYARRHANRVYGRPVERGPAPATPPPSPPPPTASPELGAGDGDGDSSTTNVQEAGVDEPDLVKNDGSTIFVVQDAALHAIDARARQPRLLDSLALGGWSGELLLDGDRLLVISSAGGAVPLPGVIARSAKSVAAPDFYRPQTTLTEVDVSDPGRMRVVRTQVVDGSVVSARLNGHSARIVITSPPAAIAEGGAEARSRPSGWVPRSKLTNASTGRSRTRALSACRAVRAPRVFAGLDMLSVLTVDMTRGLPSVDVDSVMASGELVYASGESLYVATQRWAEPPDAGERPPRSTTAIHKFDITDPRETRYRATGSVTGYLLNQFAMSERRGVLRVASTDSPTWWPGRPLSESESHVTTLVQDGSLLRRLGGVGGLGRGERIYAVRFFDDRGFVVTFRQVDPLYAIDLSDPARPRVAGELKIEGYSAYLHPVGDDLLLGIGQDASSAGRVLGTQLSLFDVSDLSRPVRIQSAKLRGSSSSTVEYDHHAFLWWGPEKLAVVPVSVFDGSRGSPFQGAFGFRVDPSGIVEVGRTSHDDGSGYAPILLRSLVVRGRLFTTSFAGVALNDIRTLRQQAFVRFPRPEPPPPPPGAGGTEPSPPAPPSPAGSPPSR